MCVLNLDLLSHSHVISSSTTSVVLLFSFRFLIAAVPVTHTFPKIIYQVRKVILPFLNMILRKWGNTYLATLGTRAQKHKVVSKGKSKWGGFRVSDGCLSTWRAVQLHKLGENSTIILGLRISSFSALLTDLDLPLSIVPGMRLMMLARNILLLEILC